MRKIENIIESCTDCRFAKEFQEKGGNTDFVLICTKSDYEDDDMKHENSFMVARASKNIKGYLNVDIPPNCPLEDYDESLLPSDIIHNCEMKSNPTG